MTTVLYERLLTIRYFEINAPKFERRKKKNEFHSLSKGICVPFSIPSIIYYSRFG